MDRLKIAWIGAVSDWCEGKLALDVFIVRVCAIHCLG
jgi:hypothetical protein